MRIVFAALGVVAFVACGDALTDDSVEVPDRNANDAGDGGAATADGTTSGDASPSSDGAEDEDAGEDVDAGCLPRTRCADDASVCTFEHTCVPLLAVGASCDESYQCATKRCDPDGGRCTDSTAFFSCIAEGDGCLGAGAGCCLGTYCGMGLGKTECLQCAPKGSSCFAPETCCSKICTNAFCQ